MVLDKRKWITAGKETVFKNGMLETQYWFGRTGDWKLPFIGNHRLQGVTLRGKVLRRVGERIKLWLDMDPEQPEEKAYWYPYLPDTGNILYAMPEKGVEMALYFPNDREKDGIVTHSFSEKEQEKRIWDTSIKKLETPDGKKIKICMDVCMIDVTDIDCKEGDSVEIFGDHLPITVLSDALDTIPYEVLTSISTRVKRVYYQD